VSVVTVVVSVNVNVDRCIDVDDFMFVAVLESVSEISLAKGIVSCLADRLVDQMPSLMSEKRKEEHTSTAP
jgi:hypothetical protein